MFLGSIRGATAIQVQYVNRRRMVWACEAQSPSPTILLALGLDPAALDAVRIKVQQIFLAEYMGVVKHSA